MFLSNIVEIKGRKEIIEKVERKVRDRNTIYYK